MLDLLPVIHRPAFLSVLPLGARLAAALGLGAGQMHVLTCNTHEMVSCIPE